MKSWKLRWFVLTDNCLYYFKTEKGNQPLGIMCVRNRREGERETKRKTGRERQRERERERGLVSRQSLRHKPIGTRRERERERERETRVLPPTYSPSSLHL